MKKRSILICLDEGLLQLVDINRVLVSKSRSGVIAEALQNWIDSLDKPLYCKKINDGSNRNAKKKQRQVRDVSNSGLNNEQREVNRQEGPGKDCQVEELTTLNGGIQYDEAAIERICEAREDIDQEGDGYVGTTQEGINTEQGSVTTEGGGDKEQPVGYVDYFPLG